MNVIRPPQPVDYAQLFLLGAVWGSAFLCIDIALTSLAPMTVAATRIVIGGAVLMAVVLAMRIPIPTDPRTLGLLTVISALNTALPFFLISWGQQFIDAGRAAILMSFGPFVALTLGHVLTADDRMTAQKLVGVALGFVGVATLIGWDVVLGQTSGAVGQLAVIGAASCYALAGALSRHVGHVPPLANAGVVLALASVYTVPLALVMDRPWTVPLPAAEVLIAVGFLGVMPTALCYVLRFQLIRAAGATFMSQVSYLVPVFGVLWSWVFLAQVPAVGAFVALALILAGIAVSRFPRRRLPFGLASPRP